MRDWKPISWIGNLTVRQKTVLIVSLTLLLLVSIVFAVSQTVVMGSYADLEQQDTEVNVNRALSALREELDMLAIMANDWATWDDTYRFMQDLNQEYIETNLVNTTFSGLGLNVIFFVDPSGQVVYAKGFDLKAGQETSLPVSLLEHIAADSPLVYHSNEESSLSGVIVLPEGPMLTASEPILTSEGEGPIRGALVFGRYLDSDGISKLAKVTGLPITMYGASEAGMPDDFKQALLALAKDKPVFVRPQNDSTIAGYGLVTDIYGEPALILRVDLPRSIYHQGKTMAMYVVAFLGGGTILVGGLCLLLLQTSVLSPLSRLSTTVRSIRSRKDLDTRVPYTGNNEISSLASEINQMLEALKQSQEELKLNEERFRALLENSSDGIVVLNSDGTVQYESDSFRRILGYKPEERIGHSIFELVHPDDLPRVLEEFRRLSQTPGMVLRSEARARHSDGSWHVLETVAQNLLHVPSILGIVGNVRDITERKRIEEALRESERNYRLLFESTRDGLFVVDPKTGRVLLANEAAARLARFSRPEDIIGNVALDFVHPDDRALAEKYTAERMQGRASTPSLPVRFRALTRDRMCIWVSVVLSNIEYQGKAAILVAFRDITERVKWEEEKARLDKQLQLTGRLAAVGELAAGVAHELNNPLAAIQGYAQLLTSKKDLDEVTRKDVDTIYREALRASKITKNLLSFARRHEPEKRLISINEVVEKTLELRAHQMKVNNIELVTELQPDLPRTMADFYQMQQVFMNIVVNAEQAMSEAHGRGRLLVKSEKVGGIIRVSFEDDGPGIPKENLQRIFDPFFTTKDVDKGTGLGLSICYGIVTSHEGNIYARSEQGKGATFVVEIPVVSDAR
jgi:PAS domain S-box-containing protein